MQIKLVKKTEPVKDVGAFSFTKPKGFKYKAGQFAEFQLPNCQSYFFSFTSAPYQRQLLFVTRRSNSSFKRALFALSVGTEITVRMPLGNFTLHPEPTIPAIFFAGGMGITPFVSMITQAAHEKIQQYQHLFYVNKTTQDALFFSSTQTFNNNYPQVIAKKTVELVKKHEPFVMDLYHLQLKYSYLTFIPFVPLLQNIITIPAYRTAKYYLCGSPKSVERFKTLLQKISIDPTQIKVEDFPGYTASV